MVKIIGNVKPEDDYTHPLGPEPNFNESVYFNFFDRAQNRGGFLRIGNRANEGQAEMTVIVYNADGSAFFNYKRPKIESNDGWNAGGLEVTVLVPGEKLRTRYEGSAVYLADPRAMKDPGRRVQGEPAQETRDRSRARRRRPDLRPRRKAGRRQRFRARALRAAHEGVGHDLDRGRAADRDPGSRAARPLVGSALLAVDAVVPLDHGQLRRRSRHGDFDRR